MNRRAFLTTAVSGIIVPKFEPIYRQLVRPTVWQWDDTTGAIWTRELETGLFVRASDHRRIAALGVALWRPQT